jgi:hypothetical protein
MAKVKAKRSSKLARLLLVAGLVAASIATACAEVISIPIGQQGNELEDTPRPQRGASSARVLAEFGEPMSLTPATGVPPISQWRYENFTVYFESDTVIHSVLRHTPKFLPGVAQDQP